MFRLDYISCLLTVFSTILIGRRVWQGWIIASANSVVICLIGLKTSQFGFVPANVFCLGMYGYTAMKWRSPAEPVPSDAASTEALQPSHTHTLRKALHHVRVRAITVGNSRRVRPLRLRASSW
jgi:hypothetical protein